MDTDVAVTDVVEIPDGSILVGVSGGGAFLSETDGDLTLRYLGDCGMMDWMYVVLSRLCCLGCTLECISSLLN